MDADYRYPTRVLESIIKTEKTSFYRQIDDLFKDPHSTELQSIITKILATVENQKNRDASWLASEAAHTLIQSFEQQVKDQFSEALVSDPQLKQLLSDDPNLPQRINRCIETGSTTHWTSQRQFDCATKLQKRFFPVFQAALNLRIEQNQSSFLDKISEFLKGYL